MEIKYDFNNMMADFIGIENGISEEEINSLIKKCERIDTNLKSMRMRGEIKFFDLPYQEDVVKDINDYADYIRNKFEYFIVLGIGGSALGGIALQKALNHPYYKLLSKDKRGKSPKVFFLDNIDPDTHSGIFDVIDLKSSCFNFISKSGNTAETNAQFLVFIERLKKALGNKDIKKHVVFTTGLKEGNFRKIAHEEGIKSFTIPKGVGGRFSVLSPVGLLPSAVSGININKLLEGASSMDKTCENFNIWENPAYMNGVMHYLFDKRKGKNISVMISYSDALFGIVDWYRQLWAESLGKKYSFNGEIVHTGQTPVKALGVTDHHSQLQLYIEGPNDKVITMLCVEKFKSEIEIGSHYHWIEGLSYLSGHSLNELFHAERIATEATLTKNARPNCSISLPEINEFTLGQLFYMFEIQTAFTGYLYNINPFDQPGVEEGKKYAYSLLGKKGFGNKKEEIEKRKKKVEKYII